MNSLARLPKSPQSLENNKVAKFGTKNVGQKRCYFKKRTEEVIYIQQKATWIAKNEPENEAGKLLKTGACGKNEPKTNLKRS